MNLEANYRVGETTLLKLIDATAQGSLTWSPVDGPEAGRLEARVGNAVFAIYAADPKGESIAFIAAEVAPTDDTRRVDLRPDQQPIYQPLLKQLYRYADPESSPANGPDFAFINSAIAQRQEAGISTSPQGTQPSGEGDTAGQQDGAERGKKGGDRNPNPDPDTQNDPTEPCHPRSPMEDR